jgi:predicted transposase YdaD
LPTSDKPYDPTLKDLVETVPEDWLALVDVPPAPVEVIDADIATVSGAADKVLRVRSDPEWLLHLEFHAGHDGATLPPLVLARNALLGYRHGLGVRSVVVVLRREADSPQLNERFARPMPHRPAPYNPFEYEVRRVWEMDPEALLSGGVGMLPLAPISNVTESELPGIIRRMEERFTTRRVRRKSREALWDATYILLGLRYSAAIAQQLLQGVKGMKESATYQAILEEGEARGRTEGRVQEAREILVELGTAQFGSPDAPTLAYLQAITEEPRLRAMIGKLRTATSWADLLGIPTAPPTRHRGRRSS